MYYPLMLDLSKFKITLIGGGKVAYRKAKSLIAYGGKLEVISVTFIEDFKTLEETGQLHLKKSPYQEAFIKESHLVIAATNDLACNEAIGKYCERHHILCNVATSEVLSSFIVPSSVQRGDLTLAVSTNGKSPALTKRIQGQLAEDYGEDYGPYIEKLGILRERIKVEIEDEKERRTLLRNLLEYPKEEFMKKEIIDLMKSHQ